MPRPAGWSRRCPASGGRPAAVSEPSPAPLRRAGGAAGGRGAACSTSSAGGAFRTLDLMVDRRVLIPRPETEQVVEVAWPSSTAIGVRARIADDPGRQVRPIAVDLGTGSGAIALALAAERTGIEVWATDVSPAALEVAGANLAGLGGWAATRVRLAPARGGRRSRTNCAAGSTWPSRTRRTSRRGEMAELDARWRIGSRGSPSRPARPGSKRCETSSAVLRSGCARRGWRSSRSPLTRPGPARDWPGRPGFAAVEVRPDLAGRDRSLVARRRLVTVMLDRGGASRRRPPRSRRRRRPCAAATSSGSRPTPSTGWPPTLALRGGRPALPGQGPAPTASSCRCSSPARSRPWSWPPPSPTAPAA